MIRSIAITCMAILAATSINAGIAATQTAGADDPNGPTIVLDYSKGGKMNPTEDFMYFVPLISPTLVSRRISEGNTQTGRMVSIEREKDGDSFSCVCVFKMVGDGSQTYMFDPNEMIAHNLIDHKKGKDLKNILEYIKFKGEGQGRMEVQGTMQDGRPIVNKVVVNFANDKKIISPVTIGLYSVEYKDGRYDYANAGDRIIARVQELEFKRADGTPKMGIEIASLKDADAKEGFWAKFKATVANFFIPPLEVDPEGNTTMLDFGHAMYRGDKVFTFPRARKLQIESPADNCRTAASGDSAGTSVSKGI